MPCNSVRHAPLNPCRSNRRRNRRPGIHPHGWCGPIRRWCEQPGCTQSPFECMLSCKGERGSNPLMGGELSHPRPTLNAHWQCGGQADKRRPTEASRGVRLQLPQPRPSACQASQHPSGHAMRGGPHKLPPTHVGLPEQALGRSAKFTSLSACPTTCVHSERQAPLVLPRQPHPGEGRGCGGKGQC